MRSDPAPWCDRSRSTDERVRHEFADSRQELGAHRRMKSFGVAGADGQYPQGALGSQGCEGHRADLDRVLAEQIVALAVAYLAAARLAALQEGFEALDVGARDVV